MPILSRTYEALMGVGDNVVSLDGRVPAALDGVVCGGGAFRGPGIVYNRRTGQRYIVEQLDGGVLATIDEHGASRIEAGGGQWAIWDAAHGYRDSLGQTSAAWHPLAVDDVSGAIAVVVDYQTGSGIAVVTAGAFTIVHSGPVSSLEGCFRDGVLSYRVGGELRFWSRGEAPKSVVSPIAGVRHSRGWRVGWLEAHTATVIHRMGDSRALVVSRGDRDFNPDIRVMESGLIKVVTSLGQAELPHELRVFTVNPTLGTVNGQVGEWIDLTQPVPVTPAPTPIPVPEPTPMPISISGQEITEVVTAAKAEVEALGHVFKTPDQVESIGFHDDDRKRALLVTLRAAWELARRYPQAGIGLEVYEGFSGVPSPFAEDGATKYSFDIILLSPSGPSVDILGAGVTPTAQIDDTDDPDAITNWQRDWRPPLNPYRGAQPTPQPVPVPPTVVAPPQTPEPAGLALVLADIQAHIHAHRDEFNEFRLQMAEMEVALRNEIKAQPQPIPSDLEAKLDAIGWPTYTGTAKGGWPVGSINFTLTPKEPE